MGCGVKRIPRGRGTLIKSLVRHVARTRLAREDMSLASKRRAQKSPTSKLVGLWVRSSDLVSLVEGIDRRLEFGRVGCGVASAVLHLDRGLKLVKGFL